jgi:hypothetical protein
MGHHDGCGKVASLRHPDTIEGERLLSFVDELQARVAERDLRDVRPVLEDPESQGVRLAGPDPVR